MVNTAAFSTWFGFPIQAIRAVLAVVITISLLRAVYYAEEQRKRHLIDIQKSRLEALEQVQIELIAREKMRQQLSSSGQLETMANQIGEIKALDKLLDKAKISEAKPEQKQTDKTKSGSKKKKVSRKTTAKKRKKPSKSDDALTARAEQEESST